MPTITDDEVDATARWKAFTDGLIWRPIAELDRSDGRPQLLRAGKKSAFGFWGDTTLRDDERGERWRDAQESMDEAPLRFEPEDFAAVDDDDWRVSLMSD